MKRVSWLVQIALCAIGGVLLGSCSENTVSSSRDSVLPETRLLYPASTAEHPMDISDSTDVYVGGRDDQSLDRIEVWAAPEQAGLGNQVDELIATLRTPLSASQIPDTLRPEDGIPVFRAKWHTQQITNGTRVRIFSRAYDAAGNNARSDIVVVRILNQGTVLRPPRPQIVVTPATGTTEEFFSFDASRTEDDIDEPNQITVRWDFNGDGVWERDWAEQLPATAPVTFKYPRTGVYQAVVEARNTYLTSQTGRADRLVEVTNAGGVPNPIEPDNYSLILAGSFFVGAPDDSTWRNASQNEFPLHEARIVTNFLIEKTEVPNAHYLQFLNYAMGITPPLVARTGHILMYHPDRVEPVEPESLPRVLADLDLSELFYDPDLDAMAVRAGAEDLPMVGVSWYGAKAFAEWRGLRLPTEHEWEIAAKGTNSGWIYPWGTTITAGQANYNANPPQQGQLRPRGSYPAAFSPFGLLDLSGNAAEWVRDWYDEYPDTPQTNPEGPIVGTLKVIRGGSFLKTAPGVRVIGREAADPEACSSEVGFRTAYTAP